MQLSVFEHQPMHNLQYKITKPFFSELQCCTLKNLLIKSRNLSTSDKLRPQHQYVSREKGRIGLSEVRILLCNASGRILIYYIFIHLTF